MAKAYISEYQYSALDIGSRLVASGLEPAIATQVVDFNAGEAQSAAFNSGTRFVRINVDAACSLLFGADPEATTNSPRMAADATEYFGVQPGDKVSFISNT